ncbi:KAP family P-loop NTPase fold protein [Neisseria sp. P0022.S007]|uniref:KAP family P-loop NTPase fold protein n=1 Tax=unclassified Neisseria TaxID=2623750 RepID=UPI003F7D62CD
METQALEKTFATHDEFNRKPIAENIIKLLTLPIDLSPMVIDGGWGTGKTEFCQKLIRLMQQQHPDYQPVYIDAFRSDHSGEPLLALLAEIIKACTPEDTGEQPSEQRKNITRKVAKAAGFVMKTVAKAAVGHVLKQNTDDLAEGLQQIINDGQDADSLAETVTDAAATIASHTIDATVEALLKEQIEAEKNLETLKACLKELAADKPIILFIDELDRCRPDYAVDMLEVIKHVFDIENVEVVLVTNTKQLRAAINHRYGAEVDAHKYLDKFLKYSFALPEKVVAQFEEERALVSVKYFKQLIRESRMASELQGLIEERNVRINFISDMVERNNLSLRETERLVRFLEIYHSLSGGLGKDFIWQYVLLRITGVFIFCFYPNLMDDINKNCAYSRDFAQIFNIQSLSNIPKNSSGVIYTRTNVIAMMLILNSQMDTHFNNFNNLHNLREWQKYINEAFLDNGEIFPPGMNGVLSILKETFRVLSFEQTPQ